jgi:hypothetical protein
MAGFLRQAVHSVPPSAIPDTLRWAGLRAREEMISPIRAFPCLGTVAVLRTFTHLPLRGQRWLLS